MRELDCEIKAWRRAMRAQLPPRTVRELETHLWEHIAALKRDGLSAEAAFARAVERLGEPQALGHEFARLSVPWMPASWSVRIVFGFVGALIAWFVVWGAMSVLADVEKVLSVAHYLTVGCGYVIIFGMGLVSLCVLFMGWSQPLASWQRRELRQTLFRMIAASAVLVPLGAALGLFWNDHAEGQMWSGTSLELGTLLFGSTALILLAARSVPQWSGRVLPWLGTLAIFAAQFGWYGTAARSAAVPSGWLVLSLFFTQAALVRLNYQRIQRRREAASQIGDA